ncbi:MAG: phosphate ABC transporter substrate-binding/OmpA family protein [Saprospiraceae bacterium]|jgi:NitT/TauT family transport system substrate-binding protein
MATRLTGFSKLVITLLILTALFFGGRYLLQNTKIGQDIKKQAEQASGSDGSVKGSGTQSTSGPRDPNTLRVQLVTWGGYAPGLYFNEGPTANEQSRFYKDYGFKVEFKVENDLLNAMNAWMAGEYDVLVQTADAFPLYTAPDDINAFKPQAFMQVDWSRGGDAVIVKRGINTANDLKGKRIAVAVPSPAQTLLNNTLEAAGLKYDDVTIVKTSDNLKAAELFRSNDVDAAVVWSPDDQLATADVPGSKILLTTLQQSHIIADIMFASEKTIKDKRNMIHGFYEGWMKGVAELNSSQANHAKAAKYLGEMNGLTQDDGLGMMGTVYWTGHGDNVNFFGLNSAYKGQKGQDLYEKMSKKFVETGDSPKPAPAWRSVIYTGAITAAENNLTGVAYAAEKSKTFAPATKAEISAPAIASKPISINFASGKFTLDENSKTIIDLQFADIAKTFANVKVRVEGNTDNVGGVASNKALSEKRAKSVADYLKSQYSMDPNRFIIVGNGSSKPVSGCEANADETCKARNRRTEFQLIGG